MHKKYATAPGFTVAELLVSIVVTGIVLLAVIGSILGWFTQYSVSLQRQTASVDIQTALDKITTDVRSSNTILPTNTTTDPNAPAPENKWTLSSNQLVLAQTPRTASGAAIYDSATPYAGTPNNVIYYLKNSTLLRRVIPAPYSNNAITLIDCSPMTGGCPDDTVILRGVSSLTFTYYDRANNPGSNASTATSVKVAVQTTSQQSGQTITSTGSQRIALINPTSYPARPTNPTTPTNPNQIKPGIMAGYGGLQVQYSSIGGNDIAVQGRLDASTLGTVNATDFSLVVGNRGCGTRMTFPQACTGQPITTSYTSTVKANPICAPGQTNTVGISGLAPCTLPAMSMPTFDKQAFVNNMTTTSSSISCNNSSSSINSKTRINGAVTLQDCSDVVLRGNIYVTGNISLTNSTLRVAEDVTTRPVIVVNGISSFVFSSVKPNSAGITPIFISFYSTDSTCSSSTSCTTLPNPTLYDSAYSSTYAIRAHASSSIYGSLYTYFGAVQIDTNGALYGSIAGQRVNIAGSGKVQLIKGEWPSS